MFQTCATVSVRNFTDNTWIPGVIKKQNGPLSYHVKLQDGCMVHRHSDHILVHPGTEDTSIVNADWMNLHDISQDSATAPPQNPRELPNVSSCPPLWHSTRPPIPPKTAWTRLWCLRT